MSRVDRAVRRASRHLRRGETLVTTAMGTEAEGRRRQVALVTDRRLLVAWLRGGPPLELDLDAANGTYDADEERLILDDGTQPVVLRRVDEADARRLVALLARRRPASGAQWDETPTRVRILGE